MKLPYGQSNFKNMATQGFYYVDRTRYIEELEDLSARFLFYLRPRKFGKSLFISMLEHYYGEQWKGAFQALFGQYYIGQRPTPLANTYLVLTLDFSGIGTDSSERVLHSFNSSLYASISRFVSTYLPQLDRDSLMSLEGESYPADLMNRFLAIVKREFPDKKLYMLIDEYDHFANELIAFRLNDFKEMVSRNGFVRKFFEVIKEETRDGLVDRLFATGVSPVTLDSLTSGFNIGKKIMGELHLHEMMGFTEAEAVAMLAHVGVGEVQMPAVLNDIRQWYNGYLFHPDAAQRLYNPNMLIYFCDHYQSNGRYPEKLLDENIASDYGKISRMLGVGGESYSLPILEKVLTEGRINAELTAQFSFDRPWVRDDYVSLLYYLGVLTVQDRAGSFWSFSIPNFVIKVLYYNYFLETLRQRADLKSYFYNDVSDAFYELSMENKLSPMLAVLEQILSRLSGRDVVHFGESHLHAIFASLLTTAQGYLVRSQPEIARKFVDILCVHLPHVPVNWNFAFELKYLKKNDATQLESKKAEARSQMMGYLQTEDLQHIPHLAAYIIVVVGDAVAHVEQVS